MDFDCGYEASEGGGVVCRVTGEIDLANAQDLKYRAIEAMKSHGPPLVIDLSGVTFMDVSGVRALLAIRRHAAVIDPSGQIELRGVARSVFRVLTLTEAVTLFRVAETPQVA